MGCPWAIASSSLHELGVVHVEVLLIELAAGGRVLEHLHQQVGHLADERLVLLLVGGQHPADELVEADGPRVLQLWTLSSMKAAI